MVALFPDTGEQKTLEYLVNKITPEDLVLKLYSNNITPSDADTTATYTEVTGGGYAPKTLTGAIWTITPGAPTTASYPQQSFIFTGAVGNVYGYYLVRVTGNELIWVERFTNGPYNIQNPSDEIRVTLNVSLKDQGE